MFQAYGFKSKVHILMHNKSNVVSPLVDPCQKRLLDYLFNDSTNDVDIRPVKNYSQPVDVEVSTSIFQITELVRLAFKIIL